MDRAIALSIHCMQTGLRAARSRVCAKNPNPPQAPPGVMVEMDRRGGSYHSPMASLPGGKPSQGSCGAGFGLAGKAPSIRGRPMGGGFALPAKGASNFAVRRHLHLHLQVLGFYEPGLEPALPQLRGLPPREALRWLPEEACGGPRGDPPAKGGTTHLGGRTSEQKLLSVQSPPKTSPAKAGRTGVPGLRTQASATTSRSLTGNGRTDGGPRARTQVV